MDQEQLTPELEKLLKQVKLKEPSQELMAGYLTGVNAKIERRINTPHFGFREAVMVVGVGLVLAGLFYFLFARSLSQERAPEIQPALSQMQNGGEAVSERATPNFKSSSPQEPQTIIVPIPEALSLEEELVLLEAFEEELSDQESDWLEDEELLEELALLDELEISTMSVQTVA